MRLRKLLLILTVLVTVWSVVGVDQVEADEYCGAGSTCQGGVDRTVTQLPPGDETCVKSTWGYCAEWGRRDYTGLCQHPQGCPNGDVCCGFWYANGSCGSCNDGCPYIPAGGVNPGYSFYDCCTGGEESCFTAGTKVLMGDGGQKSIEDVKVEDKVVSQSEAGKRSVSTVTKLDQPVRDQMCQIKFTDGKNLKLTDEHPLFTQDGWKAINPKNTLKEVPDLAVSELKQGDRVAKADGTSAEVGSFGCWSEKIQTYNLLLDNGANTYFADGFLVHNKEEVSLSCTNITILGERDASGNLLVGNTYNVSATYHFGGQGNPPIKIMAAKYGTECRYYWRDDIPEHNQYPFTWIPTQTGTYTFWCMPLASGFGSCASYDPCKGEGNTCDPEASMTVNVVEPTAPSPVCSIAGPSSVTTEDNPTYYISSSTNANSTEIWKSPADIQSWTNPPICSSSGNCSGATQFTSPGSYWVVGNAYNGAVGSSPKCTGNPFGIESGWTDCGDPCRMQVTVTLPPPTAWCTVPDQPYGGNPGITLYSTNASYCYVEHDWSLVDEGDFTSGTYYPGSQTTPGNHQGEVSCYNSAGAWSGWYTCNYTVSPCQPSCSSPYCGQGDGCWGSCDGDAGPPPAPSLNPVNGGTVTVNEGEQATMSWSASDKADIYSFDLYPIGGDCYSLGAYCNQSTANLSFSFTPLYPSYHYRVRGINTTCGNEPGDWAEATFTLLGTVKGTVWLDNNDTANQAWLIWGVCTAVGPVTRVQPGAGSTVTVNGNTGTVDSSGNYSVTSLFGSGFLATLSIGNTQEYYCICPANNCTYSTSSPKTGLDYFVSNVKPAWWQAVGGNIHADTGDVSSKIPNTCLSGSCKPYLITKDTNGTTGMVSYAGAVDVGNGGISEDGNNWRAETTYNGTRTGYDYFKRILEDDPAAIMR